MTFSARTWKRTMPAEHAGISKEGTSTAADVYSLGANLYKMLTGETLFEAGTLAEAIRLVRDCAPPSPRTINPKIDERLEAMCLKCLEKDPQQRYASAEALADDLDRWLKGEPPLAWPLPWRVRAWRVVRRYVLVVIGAAGLGFVAAALFFVLYYFEPDRVPRALVQKAKTDRLTLIGKTGHPPWWRWNVGEGLAQIVPENIKPFCYAALETGRLELLPDTPERYRLSAEVRHDKVFNDLGLVGIYVAQTARPIEGGIKTYWCTITFADLGRLANSRKGAKPNGKYSEVKLSLGTLNLTSGFKDIRDAEVNAVFESGGSSWRRIAVEVTPRFESGGSSWRRIAVEVTPRRDPIEVGR